MLLTLTNPVENITHVTLSACEDEDPDDINSTAKVVKYFDFILILKMLFNQKGFLMTNL